jgi:hypothetical protein
MVKSITTTSSTLKESRSLLVVIFVLHTSMKRVSESNPISGVMKKALLLLTDLNLAYFEGAKAIHQ